MAEQWDTFALFETLLDDFGNHLANARNLSSAEREDSLELRIALIGFGNFCSMNQWSQQHSQVVSDRLKNDLSMESLSWYEECAESIALFACLALGAMLGKYESGFIDDVGFTLGDAHLAAFLSLNDEEICARRSG